MYLLQMGFLNQISPEWILPVIHAVWLYIIPFTSLVSISSPVKWEWYTPLEDVKWGINETMNVKNPSVLLGSQEVIINHSFLSFITQSWNSSVSSSQYYLSPRWSLCHLLPLLQFISNACFFGVFFLIYYFYFYYFHLKKISRFSWHVCSSQA